MCLSAITSRQVGPLSWSRGFANQNGIEVFSFCGESDEDEISVSIASRFGMTMEHAPRQSDPDFDCRGVCHKQHAVGIFAKSSCKRDEGGKPRGGHVWADFRNEFKGAR